MDKLLLLIGEIDTREFNLYRKTTNIYSSTYIYTLDDYKQTILELLYQSSDKIICKTIDYENAMNLYFQNKIANNYLLYIL